MNVNCTGARGNDFHAFRAAGPAHLETAEIITESSEKGQSLAGTGNARTGELAKTKPN